MYLRNLVPGAPLCSEEAEVSKILVSKHLDYSLRFLMIYFLEQKVVNFCVFYEKKFQKDVFFMFSMKKL